MERGHKFLCYEKMPRTWDGFLVMVNESEFLGFFSVLSYRRNLRMPSLDLMALLVVLVAKCILEEGGRLPHPLPS